MNLLVTSRISSSMPNLQRVSPQAGLEGAYRPAEVQGAAAAQGDIAVGCVGGVQQTRRRAKQQAGDAPRRPRHRRVARLQALSDLNIVNQCKLSAEITAAVEVEALQMRR